MKRGAEYPPSYPARKLLDLVGDKWTPVVLYSLSDSTKRYSELQRDIPDITKKSADPGAAQARARGTRAPHGVSQRPPLTEYRLTALGAKLHAPVASLCEWASTHEDLLDGIHERRRHGAGG